MDGLAEFEKELALEKSNREELERKQRKHRHSHRSDEHRHSRKQSPKDQHDQKRSRDRDLERDRRRDRSRDSNSVRDTQRRYRSRDGHDTNDDERHRHKRSRHSARDTGESDGKQKHKRRYSELGGEKDGTELPAPHDTKNDLPLPDNEVPLDEQSLTRDSWMTAPSGVGIDYIHRRSPRNSPPRKEAARHQISSRELNSQALQHLNSGKTIDKLDRPTQPSAGYTFGDEGSQWRMTKLRGVYTIAEQTGREVEEVAVERFGTLQEFDEVREEQQQLERKQRYGKNYVMKEKPTGDLYGERLALEEERNHGRKESDHRDGDSHNDSSDGNDGDDNDDDYERVKHNPISKRDQSAAPVDQTTLNRLRAQLMKAKLRKAPDVLKLEDEYNQAMAGLTAATNGSRLEVAVVLDASHNRMLAGTRGEVKSIQTRRGMERGLVEANDDMSIEDMVREERRARGVAGGEGLRMAERIAKDGKFDDDLEYLDDNAEKLAKRMHKSEANLKNIAVHEFTKMNRILESCPLCYHEDRTPPHNLPLAPIASLATRVYLTLATEPELTGAEGGAVIVPIEHHTNLLECGEDEWEEIRNFMKSLTRLYHDQGRDVIFYENAAVPQRRMHAALVAVPIPYELGDTAPAFFREAMLSADEEWSQHQKIIDTGKRAREGLGKTAFRRSIAKEMPYFHAWFSLDGGLGHIVEDAGRWPKGDLFAREIMGGMLDVDASVIKRQGRWVRDDSRLDDFKKRWRKFDWTRVLAEDS